jgi:uncharacterized protein YfaP (DUF2135 family)
MDLHVQTPNEEDIYYGSRIGENGGTLDLDSNAGCNIDNINNENITWIESAPACGAHVIRVDLWSACGKTGPFPFVATVKQGDTVKTYDGTFQASDETEGGALSGTIVATVTACPATALQVAPTIR